MLAKNQVFISYRRADSIDVTGRIYDSLRAHFGKETIFKDIDNIPFGLDFRKVLDEAVASAQVFLAIIGQDWLDIKDSEGRRLENPEDFVRIEIESALKRGIPVIPVLVRGAQMPSKQDLPITLKELAYRNGIVVRSDPYFHKDMERLINGIEQFIPDSESEPSADRLPRNPVTYRQQSQGTVQPPIDASSESKPTLGLKNWPKAVIIGSLIGTLGVIALLVIRGPNPTSSQPAKVRPPSPSQPIISQPAKVRPPSPSQPIISQEEAVKLIRRWQEYKRRIFAPPYERYLGAEVLTGKAYRDNISRRDGQISSVDWLQNNGAYYIYGVQRIDAVEDFLASGDRAIIDVVITEERTLYNKNGKKDPNASAFDRSLVRYNLKFDKKKWKIDSYLTLE